MLFIMVRNSTNLYFPQVKGYYIYKVKNRDSRYLCHRKFASGYVKSWLFYSVEECKNKLDTCVTEQDCLNEFGALTPPDMIRTRFF